MIKKISKLDLKSIINHTKLLGEQSYIRGIQYNKPLTLERCAELPFVINVLSDDFNRKLKFLDIGTGESPLPTYFLRKTNWDITCIDKFDWIDKQLLYANNLQGVEKEILENRFHIFKDNFLEADFGDDKFDLITNISVIEHLEGDLDTEMMIKMASLLNLGGRLILTTPMNEKHYKEFYIKSDIYGERYNSDKPVYYQRHYDIESLRDRLITPSKLKEKSRIYFGEYGFQSFEKLIQNKSQYFRTLCHFFAPILARHFVSYRNYPVSRGDMKMNTSSGVILELVKEND